MRISLNAKNFELSSALETHIEEHFTQHIRKLVEEKNDPDLPVLHIEVGRSTRHHRKGEVYFAEANLNVGGKVFYAKVDHEDIYSACDLLRDELESEIKKFSGRREALQKRGAREIKEGLRNAEE